MSDVKRVEIDHKGLPFFDDRGVYVLFEDYDKLKAQHDELKDDLEVDLKWRDLALQFDGHRMQALWFLKKILNDLPEGQFKDARDFLSAGPLSGEEVLRVRIGELADARLNKIRIETVQKLWDDSLRDVGFVLGEIRAYRDESESAGIVHSEIKERVEDFISGIRGEEKP